MSQRPHPAVVGRCPPPSRAERTSTHGCSEGLDSSHQPLALLRRPPDARPHGTGAAPELQDPCRGCPLPSTRQKVMGPVQHFLACTTRRCALLPERPTRAVEGPRRTHAAQAPAPQRPAKRSASTRKATPCAAIMTSGARRHRVARWPLSPRHCAARQPRPAERRSPRHGARHQSRHTRCRTARKRAQARPPCRARHQGHRDQTCTSSTYPQARYRPDYSREYESPQKQDRSHEGLYTPWVGPHDNELNHLPSTCFVLPRRPCDHGDMRRPLPSGRHLQQQERHQRDERRLQYFLNPSPVRT